MSGGRGLVTMPHTHYCGYCRQFVDCPIAAGGGCLFAATSPMTCNPCAERRWPDHVEAQPDLFAGTEETA